MTGFGATYPRPPNLRVCFKRSGRTGGVSSVIRGGRERGARPRAGMTPSNPAWPSERKAAQSSTAPSTPVSRRGPQGVRPNLHVWDVTDAPQTYNSSGIRRRPTHLPLRGDPIKPPAARGVEILVWREKGQVYLTRTHRRWPVGAAGSRRVKYTCPLLDQDLSHIMLRVRSDEANDAFWLYQRPAGSLRPIQAG